MTAHHLILHTDGGARGNPGPAAIGVVIKAGGQIIATISRTIGVTTNNQAEYQAVAAGLEYARGVGADQVDVYCDSELVVHQLRGKYKVKHRDLGPWVVRIHSLANQIGRVTYSAVPREANRGADALVNRALDAASGI
ncbi:MAG: ribonuclease HI family protein [Candidatus Kerfeldbacteria bacterium]|nr:ribonuclease HI family protein [Candidatus Kerfeldbacteria bacterium]